MSPHPPVDRFAQWWSTEDLRELPMLLRLAHLECDETILTMVQGAGHPRLPMSAWLALRRIGPRGRPATRLTIDLRVSRQAMSTMLRDLQRQELVTVKPFWESGRLVQLTPKGESARDAFDRATDEVLGLLGDAVPDDLTARMVLGLNLLAYHDGEEWLRLLSIASAAHATVADVAPRPVPPDADNGWVEGAGPGRPLRWRQPD